MSDKIIKNKLIASPRDFFLHLLAIITLYASAISVLVLLFQYVNILFPDELDYYSRLRYDSLIRSALSVLIVVFPAYIISSWILAKAYIKNIEKRKLRIRKWLIYFTLFVAAVVVIVDLVVLVNHFLGGELTTRFILKVISVFLVTGSIFGYYLWDIKRDDKTLL